MSNRDAAKLGFRLLGLWFMANAAIGVAGIPYYWDPQWEGVRAMTVFATVLPAIVAVGIGVPVWLSADWFASRTFAGGSESTEKGRLRGEPLFALSLAIVGALFVCESLPTLVNGLALFVQSRVASRDILGSDQEFQRAVWDSVAKANVVAGVARLLIGVGLLAGPANLARALARVRGEWAGELEEQDKA